MTPDPPALRKIIDDLHVRWRQISQVIWVLEGLGSGKRRRGRPPNFAKMKFGPRRKRLPKSGR